MHRAWIYSFCFCMVLPQLLGGPPHSLTHFFLSFMQSISVFGCQAHCGALLGGVSPDHFSKCSRYGRERGAEIIIPSLVPLLLFSGHPDITSLCPARLLGVPMRRQLLTLACLWLWEAHYGNEWEQLDLGSCPSHLLLQNVWEIGCRVNFLYVPRAQHRRDIE